MPTQAVAQLALDEKIVDDAGLLEALEDREDKRAAVSAARGEYEEANDRAMALIGALDLKETAIRVGRWRIELVMTPARHVEFDAEAKPRVQIKPAGEE